MIRFTLNDIGLKKLEKAVKAVNSIGALPLITNEGHSVTVDTDDLDVAIAARRILRATAELF